MKSARLTNGDLVLTNSGDLSVVRGRERLVQELSCWLLEPFAFDPIHPGFGSLLPQMIGEALLNGTVTEIASEVRRVLGNYIAYQSRVMGGYMFKAGQFVSRYSPDEIIVGTYGVSARVYLDSVILKIGISTLDGQKFVISRTVNA